MMALRPRCFVTNAFPSSYHHPNPKGLLLYLTNHQLLRSKFRLGQTVHFSALVFPQMSFRMNAKEMRMVKAEFQESKGRKAQFVAERKERTQLPRYADDCGRVYQFSEFLSHPLGLESILNARAMQSFQNLDSNTFRCTLPNFQFFKFKLAPVMDLRVTPTSEDCTVELLSCKFEGSDDIKQQDDLLSVFMRNYITWDANSSEPTMDVDVKLIVTLEVSSLPFRLVPLSAIETPGNVIMKGLIDVYVPLLLQQMHEDYYKWVQEQSKVPL
ncbi:putative methyltransferase-like protein 15 isoform X1 [Cinnamomum micranthum f. kanehirae]|uniref:Putative methyltransferase-like protein 15 isoform X1 n=1 Tax=Cinnamomum micranthum f. kanehirae TaxID=337451 RepID=A0A443PLC9_9MAGN|nr:putative methyltransferase-like protein 15 isoform X1 [Cinnamomum micranthum f. kanehirae]